MCIIQRGMGDIGLDRLHEVLSGLGDLLEAAGEAYHLVVIGGSGLVAIDAVSRTTRDVDVVALVQDGALVSAEPLPDAVAEAAATVARDLGLDANWLNAGPTGLQQLEPTPAELRDAARWARTHNAPGPFDDQIARALDDFGVRDEGRDV